MGHTVVIPETALLEFDRQQREAAATARTELENAYSILETNGVPFTKLDPGAVVQPGNLTEIASAIGVAVEVVRPTLEDFEDAHRRACLHESPQPPDAKSDEMRDLVIWAIALRLSRLDRGALLVSKDVVHTHDRGHDEARLAGLERVDSPEEALALLEVQTPAARAMEELLHPAWNALRLAGLPTPAAPRLRRVTNAVFVQGTDGIASASCDLAIQGEAGQEITANVSLEISSDSEVVHLSSIVVAGSPLADLQVEVRPTKPRIEASFEEDLSSLRELLGGGE
jgi:hypothetical protein